MKWTTENILTVRETFEGSPSIDKAMARIRRRFGNVSIDAVRHAFYRKGWGSPTLYLNKNTVDKALDGLMDSIRKSVTENPPNPSIFSVPKPTVLRSDKTTRIVVVSDLHAPYHDKSAWSCLLQVIRDTSPGTVVIIGDFADCLAISSHPKSLDRKHDFAAEVEGVNLALDELREAAGTTCRLVWTLGNHEDRITRYLQSSAPELGGIKELRAEGLFKVKERGIECIPYRDSIKIGNCSFTHDVGRCGVNTARQSLMDWGGNLVVGHSHRGGIAFQGEAKGSSHFCLNVGWLGDVEAIDYQHKMRVRRDHQCGFGIVDQSPSGYSWPQFIPVLNGECVVDGKVIRGDVTAIQEAA